MKALKQSKQKSSNPPNGPLLKIPAWAADLLKPARFKAVYSGRAGGKSHFFAEYLLARMIADPDLQAVCIRKYRATITNSIQLLLANKIDERGWHKYFDVQRSEIKRIGGRGKIAFIGMQDHNASSIKGYEGFGVAWVDEATELDQYSLDLLIPTLRTQGAETWFSWNPDQQDDPVDAMFRPTPPKGSIVKRIHFTDNPFNSQTTKDDYARDLERDPEKHAWVWDGEYNVRSDVVVFAGRWRVAELDTAGMDGPYYGADWGFATDPTAVIEVWVNGNSIYISRESYAYQLPIDKTARRWLTDIPGIERHVCFADNARPESINLVRRMGLPRLQPCNKWSGSVEDGVEWLRSQDIVVHPKCKNMQTELKRYRYKQRRDGEVIPVIVDKDNHLIDCLRYGLQKLIQKVPSKPGKLGRARW